MPCHSQCIIGPRPQVFIQALSCTAFSIFLQLNLKPFVPFASLDLFCRCFLVVLVCVLVASTVYQFLGNAVIASSQWVMDPVPIVLLSYVGYILYYTRRLQVTCKCLSRWKHHNYLHLLVSQVMHMERILSILHHSKHITIIV